MKYIHTQLDIDFFVTNGIKSWLTNDLISFGLDTSIDPVILSALKYQLILGWDTLLHEFISRQFVICQQDTYSEMSSRKLSTTWGVQLIHRLWTTIQLHCNHRNYVVREAEIIHLLSGVG